MSASDYYDRDFGRLVVSVCRRCGAVVMDTGVHDAWHGAVPDPSEAAVVWLPTGPLGGNGDRMVVCEVCGSKRCPHAHDPFKHCREVAEGGRVDVHPPPEDPS